MMIFKNDVYNKRTFQSYLEPKLSEYLNLKPKLLHIHLNIFMMRMMLIPYLN